MYYLRHLALVGVVGLEGVVYYLIPYKFLIIEVLDFLVPIMAVVLTGSLSQVISYFVSSNFLLYSLGLRDLVLAGVFGIVIALGTLYVWGGLADPIFFNTISNLKWRGKRSLLVLLSGVALLGTFIFFGSTIYGLGALVVSVLGSLSPLELPQGVILSSFSWFSIPLTLALAGQGVWSENGGGVSCVGTVKGEILNNNHGRLWRPRWVPVEYPFCIDLQRMRNYNLSVSGTSGSGKSTLIRQIIRGTSVSVTVFDLHGEHRVHGLHVISGGSVSVNPLSLLGSSPRQRAIEVSYMVKSLFSLGPLQSMALTELILQAYEEKGITEEDKESWSLPPPTFRDVIRLATARDDGNMSSLLPYVTFLSTGPFNAQGIDLDELLLQSSVIDLSGLPSDEVRYVVMETLIRSVVSLMYRQGPRPLWKLLIIDEAPFILSKESGLQLLTRLMAEGRKFGVGIVISSQSIKYLKGLISNSARVFVFSTVEPDDLYYASQLLSAGQRNVEEWLRSRLVKLKKGTMVTLDEEGNLFIVDSETA
ncbi:hypothetical protein HS1genome_0312 [Sulfodiicoccus acidiphilus]|uniref:Helicase HerA central domain-containing protein n=1 Tax=Sulfodiicoccus acidiphilus TaxID=1670455 RepID=A0A348B171_9CREN|nr:ATP-binding protein [Sulfodiicoccus acidiphilus]BBD71923.1 hypothetical protein HS1genome_0312 [Sulfodiicoccus acidiphilus]GGT91484.1 hypothetical protein GCM10007116_06500 [Sulfodiicoccus acidiphilus]